MPASYACEGAVTTAIPRSLSQIPDTLRVPG